MVSFIFIGHPPFTSSEICNLLVQINPIMIGGLITITIQFSLFGKLISPNSLFANVFKEFESMNSDK